MREWPLSKRLAVQFLVAVAIGGIVALIGPFGTFNELKAVDRYLYWVIIIPLNWAQITLLLFLVSRLSFASEWPRVAVIAIACAVASIPASFEVLWLEQLFRIPSKVHLTVWTLYPYVLLLSLIITLPFKNYMGVVSEGPSDIPAPAAGEEPPSVATPPRFMQRVPAHLNGALLCIEAEDHYLRVHTDAGSDLILYRMADALSDLNGADGLQVHRSYWVARSAIADVERNGKRVSLKLANGLNVPVSRTFLPAVRDAGWLEQRPQLRDAQTP